MSGRRSTLPLEGDGYPIALEAQRGPRHASLSAIDHRFRGTGFGATQRPGGRGWTVWKDSPIDEATATLADGEP